MANNRNLFLIDRDDRRRAAVCFLLAQSGFHIEPFEDVAEFSRQPRAGMVLAYDADGVLDALVALFDRTDNWLPVVAFAEQPDAGRVVQAIRNGAVDFLSWPADQARLVEVLSRPDESLRPLMSLRADVSSARRRVEQLTGREREVLAGVANGMSNHAIAEMLGISRRTVEVYRANMLTKLAARNSPDAVRIAVDAGISF
jgi:FixJ family two-component response regulator